MTKEEQEFGTVRIEITATAIPQHIHHGAINNQIVAFAYDRNTKGRGASMYLTSNSANGIDAPDHQIYFEIKELKKILEFLIESEK